MFSFRYILKKSDAIQPLLNKTLRTVRGKPGKFCIASAVGFFNLGWLYQLAHHHNEQIESSGVVYTSRNNHIDIVEDEHKKQKTITFFREMRLQHQIFTLTSILNIGVSYAFPMIGICFLTYETYQSCTAIRRMYLYNERRE